MLAVPTALLLHTTDDGQHHDWLIGDPEAWPNAQARLWTARVQPPSTQWAALGQFPLTPLPPHRAIYLHYEGPISGNRGHVRRVDAGYALVLLWQPQRAVLAVRMHGFTGRVELVMPRADTGAGEWTARVLDRG